MWALSEGIEEYSVGLSSVDTSAYSGRKGMNAQSTLSLQWTRVRCKSLRKQPNEKSTKWKNWKIERNPTTNWTKCLFVSDLERPGEFIFLHSTAHFSYVLRYSHLVNSSVSPLRSQEDCIARWSRLSSARKSRYSLSWTVYHLSTLGKRRPHLIKSIILLPPLNHPHRRKMRIPNDCQAASISNRIIRLIGRWSGGGNDSVGCMEYLWGLSWLSSSIQLEMFAL